MNPWSLRWLHSSIPTCDCTDISRYQLGKVFGTAWELWQDECLYFSHKITMMPGSQVKHPGPGPQGLGDSHWREGEVLMVGDGDLLFGKGSILPWYPLGGSEFSSSSPSLFGFKRKPRCAFLLGFCCSNLAGHKPNLAWMTSVIGQTTVCSSRLCWGIFNKDFPCSVFQFSFSFPLQCRSITESLRNI